MDNAYLRYKVADSKLQKNLEDSTNSLNSVINAINTTPNITVSSRKPLPADGKNGDLWVQYK